MTAIDPKETARYTARLFGYFLVVAIVGGGITAGGVALLRNQNVFSGSIDANAEVIVGGALAGVGILLVLAGFLAIVLNVVADGVRFGLEGTTTPDPDPEPARAPAPAWTPGERRRTAGPAPRRRPPARERERDQSREAGGEESNDDETWKREVEEKLADEDRPGRTGGPEGRATSTAEGTDRDPSSDVSSPEEGSPGAGAGPGHETETGRERTRESGVERDPGGERPVDPTDAGTGTSTPEPAASSETDRSNSEAWVSGDEVNGEESTEAGEGIPPETGADDDPLAPGSADEPEPTDAADDDSDSPAWLEGTGSEGDENDR